MVAAAHPTGKAAATCCGWPGCRTRPSSSGSGCTAWPPRSPTECGTTADQPLGRRYPSWGSTELRQAVDAAIRTAHERHLAPTVGSGVADRHCRRAPTRPARYRPRRCRPGSPTSQPCATSPPSTASLPGLTDISPGTRAEDTADPTVFMMQGSDPGPSNQSIGFPTSTAEITEATREVLAEYLGHIRSGEARRPRSPRQTALARARSDRSGRPDDLGGHEPCCHRTRDPPRPRRLDPDWPARRAHRSLHEGREPRVRQPRRLPLAGRHRPPGCPALELPPLHADQR